MAWALRRKLPALTIAALSSIAAPAAACPGCEPGRQARAELWRDDFAHKLAVASFPFAIVLAASAYAEGIGRPRRKSSRLSGRGGGSSIQPAPATSPRRGAR